MKLKTLMSTTKDKKGALSLASVPSAIQTLEHLFLGDSVKNSDWHFSCCGSISSRRG